MVTAEESRSFQHFSARKLPELDDMALLQLEQNYSLPYFLPTTVTADAAFPGQLREVDTVRQGAGVEKLKLLPSHWGVSHPAGYHYPRDTQYVLPHRLGGNTKPIDIPCAPQKRFLIFDQSGNNTRLFVSPSFPPKNQGLAFESSATVNGFNEPLTAQVGQQFLVNPKVEEKWDENALVDEDSEMIEDSEEINALLYSDSEYDDDDTDDENDEVTSTLQTPSTIRDDYNKDKPIEELKEEVASSDDSPKRQRLLDGTFKKTSLMSFESPVKEGASSCNNKDDDDLESCYGGARSYCNDTDLSKREKKVKIRNALKIIESILPPSNNKDPFSIIDNAILYLRSLKTDALALGLGHAESIPLS